MIRQPMPLLIWLILFLDALRGRRPMERSREEQAAVDAETASLRLFHFDACPYCRKVRRDIRLLGLKLPASDIKLDQEAREALIHGGGKKQVPCLRIEEPGRVRWLYESADITSYLRARFART